MMGLGYPAYGSGVFILGLMLASQWFEGDYKLLMSIYLRPTYLTRPIYSERSGMQKTFLFSNAYDHLSAALLL